MSRKQLILCLFLCAAVLSLSACDAKRSTQVVQEQKDETQDIIERDICTVEQIESDYFILKNLDNEKYKVDISFLGDLQVEDTAILTYSTRTLTDDGYYEADVQRVEFFDISMEIDHPA